jgi:hypothetical protein
VGGPIALAGGVDGGDAEKVSDVKRGVPSKQRWQHKRELQTQKTESYRMRDVYRIGRFDGAVPNRSTVQGSSRDTPAQENNGDPRPKRGIKTVGQVRR